MGDEPSHPELLDWLATEFVARGWSLKAMHRLIVTSATYRQSCRSADQVARDVDPENTLLWRQNRQRLDGEAIRDALLAVSGRLNQQMGGPSVFPELPPELKRLSSKGAVWPVSPMLKDRERRSFMSSSDATCGTRSSRSSTAPIPTRAAHAGRSPRSLPRHQPAQ